MICRVFKLPKRAASALMALALLGPGLSSSALAQLSSPVPDGVPGGIPSGSGPGVHSPNSPFAPLPDRNDVLPWSLLSDVKVQVVNQRVLPVFSPTVQALNNKLQRVQGFMMPLAPGERQTHFLLTSVPLTCSFCTPGGPESMIEVKTKTPIKYTLEPVVVEGTLAVLADDGYGLYYRIADGKAVK